MKYIIGFLILMASFAARAEGPTPPVCVPLVNGHPVGQPVIDKRTAAWHLFWLCGDVRKKEVHVTGWSCARGHCDEAAFAMVVASVTRASAKVGEYKMWWSEFVTVNCGGPPDPRDEVSAMCAERASIIEASRAKWKIEADAWLLEQAK
jgi:hypothetical protein